MRKSELQKHLKNLKRVSSKEDTQKGYGSDPKKFIDPLFPWFKTITYKKGPYLSVDRYSGDEAYAGQTIIFFKKRPIYSLNYYGVLVGNGIKMGTDPIYDFLKKALRVGSGKNFHRGLDGFKDNSFLYKNNSSEKRGLLEGEEKIFYKNKLVYICLYHGGMIEDSRTYERWGRKLLPSTLLKKKLKL